MNLQESKAECPECVGHTPTPWRAVEEMDGDTLMLRVKGVDQEMASVYGEVVQGIWAEETRANAAYIVRCVNSHKALVEALRSVMRQAQLFDAFRDDVGQVVLEGANAALKAEKEDSSNG